ncbi:sensor histidine kinase [Anaeromicrobium sediminis]|uniref:histidine kinase n=1 Tax=Anaeromicrobium sediminis TaxID=1478221 RepID=A0A267MCY2_9FIRM|nr:HAMP domain-containing sensor histidine kinase [Anaeromicrobium sediminis]PAB57416.1 hypothetical protein CCE28_19160 [Anaeromicrobium sediminis]
MFEKLLRIFNYEFYNIPDKYKREFQEVQIKTNFSRTSMVMNALIVLSFIMLWVDIKYFKELWDENIYYKYLFYSRIAITIFCIIYKVMSIVKDKGFKVESLLLEKIMYKSAIIIILFWCIFASTNAQHIHGQISAYIIGIFSVASILVLYPLESFIIYALTYIIFAGALFLNSSTIYVFLGNLINTLFLIVLAFICSNFRFTFHVKNFINKKIIIKKTMEIKKNNRDLENIVHQRTKELAKTSELLIKEINKRHKAEIDAIKNKTLFKEKESLLNEIMEFEKLRNIFFANISHELRTPINVIFSAQQIIEALPSVIENDERVKLDNYVGTIKQNCYRLIRLIGNLIDITKMDAGYFEIHPKNQDIIKIVEDVTMSVAQYIKDKGLSLIFDTEVEEKYMRVDEDMIERIILNLLSNAVKFTPKDGYIYVNIYDKKKSIIISVKDTGIGISKEAQDKIFDRFVQDNNTISREAEGSGIGLSLVKSLVHMHEGTVSLNSTVGEGTEFLIELPVIYMDIDEEHITRNYEQNIEKIQIEFSDIYK